MKVELTFAERSYIRGLLLERADFCRANAQIVKMDKIKRDWLDESAFAETLALLVDAGEQEKEPSQVDKRRDVDAIDPPPVKEPAN